MVYHPIENEASQGVELVNNTSKSFAFVNIPPPGPTYEKTPLTKRNDNYETS